MHRITKKKTKALQIAVVAIFMAVATFAAKPAQAKFGLVGGYKYVAVGDFYGAHVGQLDFLWTIKGGGKGYRDGGKRPRQVLGFALAIGGNTQESSYSERFYIDGTRVEDDSGSFYYTDGTYAENYFSADQSIIYFAVPLIYEYVFANGLGITGGVTLPIMSSSGDAGVAVGVGFGVSDLGLSYHFKNGLALYSRVNLGYASFFGTSSTGGYLGSIGDVMWGAGAGIGYWF